MVCNQFVERVVFYEISWESTWEYESSGAFVAFDAFATSFKVAIKFHQTRVASATCYICISRCKQILFSVKSCS